MRPNEVNPQNEKLFIQKALSGNLPKTLKTPTMQLSKGGALPPAPESTAGLQAPLTHNRSESNVKVLIPAMEIFKNTAASLGFPSDALSTSLLASLRLFSLSPAMLGDLRKEALANLRTASPKDKKEKTILESKALGIVAALDKGLKLSPAALNSYANILLAREAGKNQSDPGQKEDIGNAEELKILVNEESRQDDFLEFMNYLPGKNGQKWHVFPFTVKLDNTELCVVLRTLCSQEEQCMLITVNAPKKQWQFFLKKENEDIRVDILVYPEQNKKNLEYLNKKFMEILGKDFGEIKISIKNGVEEDSFLEILYNEPLPLVNKEV